MLYSHSKIKYLSLTKFKLTMMSPFLITVLWPKVVAPEIDEIRFSYDFCLRLSKQFCEKANLGFSWVEYTNDSPLEKILPLVEGDLVLLVTEPEIILSPQAVKVLIKCSEQGHAACGPVYNQTAFSHQIAALPAPYLNIETYLEIAEALAENKKNRYIPVDTLDPACVLYRIDFLKEISAESPLSEISQAALNNKKKGETLATATGALVHLGFWRSFQAHRNDLVSLVPDGLKRILDIGSAMGGYGKTLKRIHPEIFLTGVEPNPIMAEAARPYYDELITCPVEEADLTTGFDLINCGDVIEHLQDPWGMLKRLHGLLREGGYLVMSIPNVGHWSIVKELLKGKFQYIPLGLLCIGHLRWFTASSIRQALEGAGFLVEVFQTEQIPPSPKGNAFIHEMCNAGYGDAQSLRTNEFIIRAVKKVGC